MTGKTWTVNWQSDDNEIISFFSDEKMQTLKSIISERFKGHIFVSTSGTTGFPKWVAISKKAMLLSAKNVNNFINLQKKDSWFSILPSTHMGALAISARAHLSDSKITYGLGPWNPKQFVQQLSVSEASLSSLVPTQLHDLVNFEILSPTNLRVVFVGGGVLTENLYHEARKLNWPVLPTYGLTEASSQVATSPLSSLDNLEFPEVQILPHFKVEMNETQNLVLRGDSLFTAYITENAEAWDICERKQMEFTTEDKGSVYFSKNLKVACLKIYGRDSHIKKVGGVLVNANGLDKQWKENHKYGEVLLIPDGRLENRVALIVEEMPGPQLLQQIEAFNNSLSKEEKISIVYKIAEIPRTQTGKVNYPQLIKILQ
ncbi:MAG: AMP-binding protein [Bdellovibrionaceae bacterium]|nr:AMP-binding protein [Pseudobdellovibrionaceae bacterium]